MSQMTDDNTFSTNDVVGQDANTLAAQLAVDVADNLRAGIAGRGYATLVVSGGSTPVPFFKALSDTKLEWNSVTVLLADERWVGPEHPDSNERFVRQHLLINEAGTARFVSLKNDAATPEDGWSEAEKAMAEVKRPFDVVILGMGEDGHTASLFPQADGLDKAIAKGCGRATWPMNPISVEQARMTLTLDCLLDTRHLYLHITGDEKRAVYRKAATVDPAVYPIAAVIKAAADRLKVYWAL